MALESTTSTSRDLNSGYYESQGVTTDGYAGTSPSVQVSDTINGTATATETETEETTDSTSAKEYGLAAAEADLRPYSERRGDFGSGYDNYGEGFENFGGGSTEESTSSASASMLESSWDANEAGNEDTEDSADASSSTASTWDGQDYSPGNNTYSTTSGKYTS